MNTSLIFAHNYLTRKLILAELCDSHLNYCHCRALKVTEASQVLMAVTDYQESRGLTEFMAAMVSMVCLDWTGSLALRGHQGYPAPMAAMVTRG